MLSSRPEPAYRTAVSDSTVPVTINTREPVYQPWPRLPRSNTVIWLFFPLRFEISNGPKAYVQPRDNSATGDVRSAFSLQNGVQ